MAPSALEHDAYVWQREWTPQVVEAVAARGAQFRRLIVLGGEIAWREHRGELTRANVDLTALRRLGRPCSVALRVGTWAGPFEASAAATVQVRSSARELVDAFRGAGVEVAEFQIDFDCAESRLEGYRTWVEALALDLAPLPVVITALPSWLRHREFGALVRAASGFVLQVHSVARPRTAGEPFQLCDPSAARRWVEEAGRLGVPFRVALPTYGYLVAFDASGAYLGASAEGPPPARPAGAVLREIGADPVAMARLIEAWAGERPAGFRGVLWYRLPVAGDRLNWKWTTLETVMSGRVPLPDLRYTSLRPEPGLVEVQVANRGTADRTGPVVARVRWQGARLLARDGIRGFEVASSGANELLFTNAICRLPAGEVETIGWLRFDTEAVVELNIVP